VTISETFYRENPPCPPFEKGGNAYALPCASPFVKGGLRGIFMGGGGLPKVMSVYEFINLVLKRRKNRMEKTTLSIPNISCGHCVMAIKRELGELKGISGVEGDPGKKEITVAWDAPASLDQIKSTLKAINYPAAG
jgi:copper chaperone